MYCQFVTVYFGPSLPHEILPKICHFSSLTGARRCIPLVLIACLKVNKNDNFFGSDFEFCTISLLVMLKY